MTDKITSDARALAARLLAEADRQIIVGGFAEDGRGGMYQPACDAQTRALLQEAAARLASPPAGWDAVDDVLHNLDSWCKAYPEYMFPEPDPADLQWLHETKRGLCDRISASMGRHMVKHMREMADGIRKIAAAPGAADGAQEGGNG